MAWGEELEVEWHPWSEGEMVLMDWRGVDEDDPSFLYVQPLGKHRIFVEETSLCNRPALTLQALRRRLHAASSACTSYRCMPTRQSGVVSPWVAEYLT